MTSEQWARVREILDEALARPPGERSAWVETACAQKPEIRGEVESLLDAYDPEDPLFDVPAVSARLKEEKKDAGDGAPPSPVGTPVETGAQVGRYRLLEEIGVGGMSVVYRAERADGAFEQTVAVKLLQRRLRSSEAKRRVRAERQVLASLEHPNVARLLDGGVTEGGRPYLVMEHVEGVPITEYANDHDLSLDARLDLLMQVLEAVQAAHRRLVVHRDLKPSNVLVMETEDGSRPETESSLPDRAQVKLLDFGIAKLLGDALPVTRPRTETGHHFLTPAYAAPEQVTGEDVTTATDVYQLGVLAYELLAGSRPFELSGRARAEIERVICEEPPPKPSETARSAGARLRGDLDTILLKALRKEPGRRYGSVEALAADLRRYQEGKPVEARPATLWYRMRKFAKRHRWGLGAAALVTVVIAAFVGVLLRQQGALERQRDRARTEAQTARQVSGFMVDLFEASSPYQEPDTATARTLLRRGQQRIGDLEGQPAVRARLLGAMGEAQWGLGNYERADSLLKEALSLYHREAIGAPSRRAKVLSVLGDLRSDQYRWEDAIPHLRKARSLLQETSSPPSRADTLLRAEVLKELGGALRNVGKSDSAETLVRRALTLRRQVLGPEHEKTLAAKEALAYVLRKKAGRNGSLGEAERLYREVLAAQREHGDSLRVARTLNDLGYLLGEQGNLAAEEERYRRALRIYKAQLGPAHPTILMARGNNLGASHMLQGNYAAAERILREQLRTVRAHYRSDHWRVGKWAQALGEAILFQGDNLAEAEKLLRESVRIYRASDVPDPRYVRAYEAVLGRCLLERGDVQEGLPLLQKSRPVLASDSVGFAKDLAHANVGLGLVHMRRGQYRRADSLLSVARATLDSLYYDAWDGRAPLPPVRQVERHLERLSEAWGRPPHTSGR